jgi:hypothetical protein
MVSAAARAPLVMDCAGAGLPFTEHVGAAGAEDGRAAGKILSFL